MDYKTVFTNLCLELQQNRSWIKGLGKNPFTHSIPFHSFPDGQCLLSGGTEACSLGLRETPACIHVIQRLSHPRVACWHGFRPNSQKNRMRVYTLSDMRSEKKLRVYTASEAKGLTKKVTPKKHLTALILKPTYDQKHKFCWPLMIAVLLKIHNSKIQSVPKWNNSHPSDNIMSTWWEKTVSPNGSFQAFPSNACPPERIWVIPPRWGTICDGVNCYIRKYTIYYPSL